MNHQGVDWCGRLAEAVADGRYLEDPGIWARHLRGCLNCAEIVQGLSLLQTYLQHAALRVLDMESGSVDCSRTVIQDAFQRYGVYRRVRLTTLCVLLAACIGVGTLLIHGSGRTTARDPVAYARWLHAEVFPPGAAPRAQALREDASLRAEFLNALDSGSSLVRRTALDALALGGVELDVRHLESILTRVHEDLETPIEVASLAGEATTLGDALESRRTSTLASVLEALGVQRARGGAGVPSRLVTPLLSHPVPEIRKRALFALTFDTTYRPGTELESLLAADADADVRRSACLCLLQRLGSAGAEVVAGHFCQRSDWGVEEGLIPNLGQYPAGGTLSQQRIADAGVPVRLGLEHARSLVLVGALKDPPVGLIQRGLESSDPGSRAGVARLVAAGDWRTYRVALQGVWRSAIGHERESIANTLVSWDEKVSDEPSLLRALEICEQNFSSSHLQQATDRLATSNFPTVAARARAILQSKK